MMLRPFNRMRVCAALLVCAWPVAASANESSPFLRAVDRMMVALGPENARASATIRRVYKEHLELLMLEEYTELEGALDNGGLVPLPAEPLRYNLAPRLDGPHPIGEKDLDNQHSYIAARPATIGALIEIASRVKSGPLEITSLVRHSHYQEALKATNTNATTSVPMHTMGLAFDIALVNTPLSRVHEIRDVLHKMQRDGDILFIGERRQLVFHVVPHPSRLGHFTDVYMKKVGLPPTSRSAHVVAYSPAPAARPLALKPRVEAEVIAVLPDVAGASYWTDAPAMDPVGAVEPSVAAAVPTALETAVVSADRIVRRWFVLLAGLLIITWRLATRAGLRPDLLAR